MDDNKTCFRARHLLLHSAPVALIAGYAIDSHISAARVQRQAVTGLTDRALVFTGLAITGDCCWMCVINGEPDRLRRVGVTDLHR